MIDESVNTRYINEYDVSFEIGGVTKVTANYYTLSKRGNVVEFWEEHEESDNDRLVIAFRDWSTIELISQA